MKTDLIESAGRAPEVRLHHPMPRSIGSGLSKIDMTDREVDNRSADSHRKMHGACVIGQQETTVQQQGGELRQGSLSHGIAERGGSTCLPVGCVSELNGFPFFLGADKHVADRCLPTENP